MNRHTNTDDRLRSFAPCLKPTHNPNTNMNGCPKSGNFVFLGRTPQKCVIFDVGSIWLSPCGARQLRSQAAARLILARTCTYTHTISLNITYNLLASIENFTSSCAVLVRRGSTHTVRCVGRDSERERERPCAWEVVGVTGVNVGAI